MTERGRQTQTEIQKQEFRIAPPIPVRDLLGGKQIQEPRGLNLADAPIYIASVQRGETTEYVAFLDTQLTDKTFLPFLKQAAPGGFYDTRQGVNDDWVLPDLRIDNLNNAHKMLGESWEEFETHRKLYMEILEYPVRHSSSDLGEVPTTDELKARTNFDRYRRVTGNPEAKISINSPEEYTEGLAAFLRESYTDKNGQKQDDITDDQLLDKFNQLGPKRRKKLIKEFCRKSEQLQAEEQQILEQYLSDEQYIELTIDPRSFPGLTQQGEQKLYVKAPDREDIFQSPEGKWSIDNDRHHVDGAITIFQRSATVHWDRGSSVKKTGKQLVPLLHWQTSSNPEEKPREWIFETPSQLPTDPSCPDKRFEPIPDTMAGLLSVAYFSPDIVATWPREVGLPGLRVKQEMGAAQIPVLAHMRRRDLLESDFIRAAEEHSRKS